MYPDDTSDPERDARRDKRRATGFVENPEMERLIAEPEILERLEARSRGAAAAQRLELGYYVNAKQAAERQEESR